MWNENTVLVGIFTSVHCFMKNHFTMVNGIHSNDIEFRQTLTKRSQVGVKNCTLKYKLIEIKTLFHNRLQLSRMDTCA